MDINYLSQFRNCHIQSYLLKEENIPKLENLLEVKGNELSELRYLQTQGHLNFGKRPKTEELNKLLLQAKTTIDDFLDTKQIDTPACHYLNVLNNDDFVASLICFLQGAAEVSLATAFAGLFVGASFLEPNLALLIPGAVLSTMLGIKGTTKSTLSSIVIKNMIQNYNKNQYFPIERFINLSLNANRIETLSTIDHEYVHHIQHEIYWQRIFTDQYLEDFAEGHAMGVTRYTSASHAEKENNKAFLYESIDRDIGHIKCVYSWISEQLGTIPNKKLLDIKSINTCKVTNWHRRKPGYHAIGNAFFMLLEQKHGTSIYKDILKGKFNLE